MTTDADAVRHASDSAEQRALEPLVLAALGRELGVTFGVPCRKVIAVIDEAAVAHLRGGWNREFAEHFGIDVRVVPGFTDRHDALRAVQERQRR